MNDHGLIIYDENNNITLNTTVPAMYIIKQFMILLSSASTVTLTIPGFAANGYKIAVMQGFGVVSSSAYNSTTLNSTSNPDFIGVTISGDVLTFKLSSPVGATRQAYVAIYTTGAVQV